MQLLSNTAVVFAATATTMIVSPSLVRSFQLQPIMHFSANQHQHQRPLVRNTVSLRVSSPPDQSEDLASTVATEIKLELQSDTKPELPYAATIESSSPGVVSQAAATATMSATAISTAQARTMDEGIYGFNKKLIDTVYDVICFLYPVKGNDRDFARFYVLETVARVPYFAYLSVMHLRETFGERYDKMSDRMRTHYAEADNELHHLLIMESLGGNSNVVDRTLAQTMAFFYYWYVIGIYTFNEPAAYHLSELIEDHAFDTYSKFTATYEDRLKNQPVPDVARKYYEVDNPFLFDLFCTVKDKTDTEAGTYSQRRPQLESLYDVFTNIRDDEKEHWKTLCNLVQYDDMNAVDASEIRSTTPAPAATAGALP